MNCECEMCKNNKPFEMPNEIVEAAIEGNLVLFCGAGISTESKNVLPHSFYTSIKSELSVDEDLSFSQLMQRYCDQPNGRKKLLNSIRKRFEYIKSFPELERIASSFHRELAEIYQIKTIITTNWDTYFEDYCSAIPITIPEDFAFWDDNERYVLKIHGSINNLSTLIATEDDYLKCYDSLQKGAIGATLKHILTTKTVVFIGFSFGDDDLNQIMNYLHKEMNDIYPHVYLVTIDDKLKDQIGYKNSTAIVTAGTYFIHQLKNVLIDKGLIIHYDIQGAVSVLLDEMETVHHNTSHINILDYPCVVYSLVYQDGIIHALERYLQNFNTGEYCIPDKIRHIVYSYQKHAETYHDSRDYIDEAYCLGYRNAHIFMEFVDKDKNVLKSFSPFYLPNAKCTLKSRQIFMDELTRVSSIKSKYTKYAKEATKELTDNEIVIHHPPYL